MNKTKKSLRAICARVALVATPALLTVACAQPYQAAQDLANNASGTVGCQSFQSNFFDELYKFPLANKPFPTEAQMRDAFATSVTQGRLAKLSSADQTRVADALSELYRLLALDSISEMGIAGGTDYEKLAQLTALEIGDTTTPEKEDLQNKLREQMTKIETLMASTDTPACAKTPAIVDAPTSSDSATGVDAASSLFSSWKTTQPKVIYGALKAMATAYQSCDVTTPAPITWSTPDIDGIKDLGVGSDGIGHRRLVASAADIMRTNPYLQNYHKPSSSCFDVTKTPLIYDYGGRPVTTTGTIDMFKNAGSGTAALGTDCSGYVFISMAAAGLRTKKSTTLKASLVHGITSHLFVEPQKNGLTCFDHATFSGSTSLKAGDVVAKSGHVLMIKSVGADPFGIASIKSVDDCKLANMSTSRFDFTIIQDSSSKNGIGIHVHRGADYLKIPDSALIAQGLLTHAVNACKAKFGAKVISKDSHVSIVRHSGSPECLDKEIKMERESCVASCSAPAAVATR